MKGNRCRLFDENLVRNIMVSTGLTILEYLRERRVFDPNAVCDFVESHADRIIENTIEDMNESAGEAEDDLRDIDGSSWANRDDPEGD
jgi:hypothetical protein